MPRVEPSDLPGQAYGSLRSAWQAYEIAVEDGDEQGAKQAACVINGIRAGHGMDPLEFDNIGGFVCDEFLAEAIRGGCPFDSSILEKLPKGSSCTDWKAVPAKSDYWKDDTTKVTRCGSWNTSGDGDGTAPPGGDGPPDGDGGGGGGDGDGIPDDVAWYERVEPSVAEDRADPTWDVDTAWVYESGRPRDYDGTVWVLILDTGDSDRTSRYLTDIRGDDVGRRTIERSDDVDDNVQAAVSWMESHDPTTPLLEFDVTIPNEIMKPFAETANRMGRGMKIRVTDAQATRGGFRKLEILGGGGLSMHKVEIPESKINGDLPSEDAALSVGMSGTTKVMRQAKKSTDVRLWTDIDPGRRLKASAGGSTRTDDFNHVLDYSGREWPKLGAADATIRTTGRNYRQAVRAVGVIGHRDADPVAVHVDDGEARLVLETDYGNDGERARAPFDLEDDEPYRINGEATIGVRFDGLDGSSKSIPKPASTSPDFYIYDGENDDEQQMTVAFNEAGVEYRHVLSGQFDVDEYDLSAPCPFAEDDATALEQPEAGDDVPAVDGLDFEGDTVVWAFPNAEGCRCGAQALQYEKLAAEHGVDVYALATSPPEDLQAMADRLDLEHVTFVSDPGGNLAGAFEIEQDGDGNLERTTLFVRDGTVTDVSEGVPMVEAPEDGVCPFERPTTLSQRGKCFESTGMFSHLEQAEEDELLAAMDHPGVYVVTGARGSGKSALAHQLGEQLHDRENITAVTVGQPKHVREHYPGHWVHVDSVKNAPPDSVLILDEAYMQFHARDAMDDANKAMGARVNTSRHCNQTMVFVSQNSRHLDTFAVGEADGLLMKEPGQFHKKFERSKIRDMTETAEEAFGQLPSSMNEQQFVYAWTNDLEGMVENEYPSWYDDTVSKSYGSACSVD